MTFDARAEAERFVDRHDLEDHPHVDVIISDVAAMCSRVFAAGLATRSPAPAGPVVQYVEDFVECETCGQDRPRCKATKDGDRCNLPTGEPHRYHKGDSHGWPAPATGDAGTPTRKRPKCCATCDGDRTIAIYPPGDDACRECQSERCPEHMPTGRKPCPDCAAGTPRVPQAGDVRETPHLELRELTGVRVHGDGWETKRPASDRKDIGWDTDKNVRSWRFVRSSEPAPRTTEAPASSAKCRYCDLGHAGHRKGCPKAPASKGKP